MSQYLGYNDIALVPQYSRLKTRKEADTSIKLGNKTFKLPVIPANMKCVISWEKCRELQEKDYFYIMHRFELVDPLNRIKEANLTKWKNISISVGIKEEDKRLIQMIADHEYRVDYITIDVAHGHHELMKEMISFIKTRLSNTFVIAGNVATPTAYHDLIDWGADAVKCGIGCGKSCTTVQKTGFGLPMVSCIEEIDKYRMFETIVEWKPLIADGGVQYNGDIAKALVAGADMVMAGSLFAACIDSPAEITYCNGKQQHKKYYGSASEYNGNTTNIEGTIKYIDIDKHTYAEKLIEIEEDLQSSISYSGGSDLKSFRGTIYVQTSS